MDIFDKCYSFTRAEETRAAGLYPYFHEITSKQHSEVVMDGRRTIMLGSNNYLGLTSDQRVIDAAIEALERYGSGCSGSRFLNGTLRLHVELEQALAEFFHKEAAMTFSTGFQTNLGIISCVAGRHDAIYFDRANHASLVDAARLSYAQLLRYNNNDMQQLEELLRQANPRQGKIIVADGVFSMEGTLANLPEIVRLARQYGARVMIDDSHSAGVMGDTGRGTGEHYGLHDNIDLYMGTFSKSFASLGGFVAGEYKVIEYLRHHSRPFIFSASMPPANVAAALKSLEILKSEPERVKALRDNAQYMRKNLEQLGLPIIPGQTPIIPILTYDNTRTFQVTRALLQHGVYVNPVVSPAVPEGSCLLRTSYMATHTHEQLDFAAEQIGKVLLEQYPWGG